MSLNVGPMLINIAVHTMLSLVRNTSELVHFEFETTETILLIWKHTSLHFRPKRNCF